MTGRRLSALLLVPVLLMTSACGETTDRDGKYDPPSAGATPGDGASETPAADGECTYTKDPGGKAARTVKFPPAKPTATKPVNLTITTNFGKVPITLDPSKAPCAVNSSISLVNQKYFDKTPCHRIAVDEGFQMLQCGDPTGTGTGGPGYVYAEETSPDLTYPAGTLAMANTGQPNSQGSQFFLVFGDTQLSPDYTVFGTFGAPGIAVLKTIAKNGIKNAMSAGGGNPKQPVEIVSIG